MTEMLYMPNIESCYIFDFEAEVIAADHTEGSVVLDRTAFYPEGGGQPSDTGMLIWKGMTTNVIHVKKMDMVRHFLAGEDLPSIGTRVRCRIDEGKRIAHMRMHTSQHLISSIAWKLYSARTVGNQIHMDRSHLDLKPVNIEDVDLDAIENEFKRMVSEDHRVYLEELELDMIRSFIGTERIDLTRLPKEIIRLRTVMIGENGSVDKCPCAGTHVRTLAELKGIGNLTKRSKGSRTTRLEYSLP